MKKRVQYLAVGSWWWRLAAVAALLIGVVGCAGIDSAGGGAKQGQQSNSGDTLEKRVAKLSEERWQKLIKGDLDAAYQYLSPATRESIPLQSYKTRFNAGLWVSAKVDTAICQNSRCEVDLTLGYKYPPIMGDRVVQTPLKEVWIVDNQDLWYLYNP